MPVRSLLVTAVVALLALAGCATPAAGPAPWPQRPTVDLAFDVAPDLRSVTGRETVTFAPDRPIC